MQIWGMGIASAGHHRGRLSGGVPDQPGRQQAPDAGRRADAPDYDDIALELGVTAHRGRSPAVTVLPSTAWHAEFDDVNNDGVPRPVRVQGQHRGAMPDYAAEGPRATCCSASPTARSWSAPKRRGSLDFEPGPRRRARRPRPRRAAGPGRGRPRSSRSRSGATWVRARATGRQPMGHWLGRPAPPAGAEPRCHRRLGRGHAPATRVAERELTVGGGHAGGELGWIHFGLGRRADARGAGPVARRARGDPG